MLLPWSRPRTRGPLSINRPSIRKCNRWNQTNTYRDTIPVLVDHHDTKQHAKLGEEDPINIVFDGVADGIAKDEEEHHAEAVKASSEEDITIRPSVFESLVDEDKLGGYVHCDTNYGPYEVNDPEGHRRGIGETGELLEGSNGNEEANAK